MRPRSTRCGVWRVPRTVSSCPDAPPRARWRRSGASTRWPPPIAARSVASARISPTRCAICRASPLSLFAESLKPLRGRLGAGSSRLAVPADRLHAITDEAAFAGFVHLAEEKHRTSVTGVGGLAVPPRRLRLVLRHSAAVRVGQAQVTHGHRVAAFGGLAIPLDRLD